MAESPDLRTQSVRGGAWAAAGAAGTAAVGLISFLVLSRILEPAAFGLMAMVEASIALGQRLMSSGLSEPLIQMQKLDDEHSDTLFWTLQASGTVVVGLIIALSGAIGGFFAEPNLPPLVAATSVILYLQACALVPGALLARRFGFSETAQSSVVSELAGGGVAIAMVLAGYGVWGLVGQRLVATASYSAMVFWRARWWPRFRWSARCFADLWRFSASRGVEGLLLFVDQQAPRIILGRFAGATELGQFVFARRIVENTVTLLNSPIRTTALSTFAVMQTDLDRVWRTYSEGIALTTTGYFPATAGLALVAPYLVPVMAGPHWELSIVLLQLLVLGAVRQSFHIWNAAVLRGLGRPQLLLVASLVRSGTNILLIFPLLRWGTPGVCGAILAGSFLSWPVALRFTGKVTGMKLSDQLRPSRAPFLSTLVMAGAVIALQHLLAGRVPPAVMLAASVGTGVAAYVGAMCVIGRSELAALARNLRLLRRPDKSADSE